MSACLPSAPAAAVAERLRAIGVIPVATLPEAEVSVGLVEALIAGGLPCIEITFRTPCAPDGIRAVRRAFPDMLVGAGTVLVEDQLEAAIEAGADFVVSPALNPKLVSRSLENGMPFLPGVSTPTELDLARRLGLRTVKLFPAEQAGGPALLRALSAPYPDVTFVPTGGITPEVLAEYLRIPQVIACGGGWMVPPELLRRRKFEQVQSLAAAARAIVEGAR